jgi:hypothetical protein
MIPSIDGVVIDVGDDGPGALRKVSIDERTVTLRTSGNSPLLDPFWTDKGVVVGFSLGGEGDLLVNVLLDPLGLLVGEERGPRRGRIQ